MRILYPSISRIRWGELIKKASAGSIFYELIGIRNLLFAIERFTIERQQGITKEWLGKG